MVRVRGASTRRPRPRGVWIALAVGVVLLLVVVGAVTVPVLGLIAAADASTAGVLDVPVGQIVVALLLGTVVTLALLAAVVPTRRTWVAVTLVVLALLVAVVASVWPLFAVALAGVDQAQDVWPFVQGLVTRYWPGASG